MAWTNKCNGRRWRTLSDGRIEVEGEGVPLLEPSDLRSRYLEQTWANWAPDFRAAARQYGVPLSWLVAIATIETGPWSARPQQQATIVSSAGAVGIMQVIPRYQPETATELARPSTNIAAGARIIRRLADGATGAELPHIASAYNAGAGSSALGVRCSPGRNEWNLASDANYPRQTIVLNNTALALGIGRPTLLASSVHGAALGAVMLGAWAVYKKLSRRR